MSGVKVLPSSELGSAPASRTFLTIRMSPNPHRQHVEIVPPLTVFTDEGQSKLIVIYRHQGEAPYLLATCKILHQMLVPSAIFIKAIMTSGT